MDEVLFAEIRMPFEFGGAGLQYTSLCRVTDKGSHWVACVVEQILKELESSGILENVVQIHFWSDGGAGSSDGHLRGAS